MFKTVRTENLKEYNGKGTLYVHDLSGMEVFHIKNDSKELTCNFAFSTPSRDDMGVAHILEHTVLCGSGRYPVKSPFDQVYLSSPNTFLNAITFTDKTMYPFCTPLKKDFDILFDIYADAVFNPLLRKESFEQEGVRFFGSSFDGVVYNEMTGALSSSDDIAQSKCMRALYDGTPFMYESGGDPLYIADLTYEEYLARYRAWYSPSNCRLFLYGDLDAREYLDKLEERYLFRENLSKWEGKKYEVNIDNYPLKAGTETRDVAYSPQEGNTDMLLTWLTKRAEDPFEIMTLSVLVDILLGNPGAPLYKAVTDSGLGEDLNPLSGTDADFPAMPFMVGFSGAEAGSEDKVESFLIDTLKKIAHDGIDSMQVEGAIKRQEFSIQEIKGSSEPYGIMVSLKAARSWLRGKGPFEGIDNIGNLEKLKKEVAKGRYFENWIENNLVNNPRHCLLTVSPDSEYNSKRKALLDAKLKNRIFSEEDKKQFERFIASEDSPEQLALIPRIKISDMPCTIPSYDVREDKFEDATVLQYKVYTRGIVYFTMAFSTLHLTEEEKCLVPLLVRLMQMTGTSKNDYVRLGMLIKNLTGGFSINTMCGKKSDGGFASNIAVKTKVLQRDVEKALELISEIIITCDIENRERINASITDLLTEFEMNYTYGGSSYASMYACSKISQTAREMDMTLGTSAWLYLKSIDRKDLGGKLLALRQKIFNQSGFTVFTGCDDDFAEKCRPMVEKFIHTIPRGEKKDVSDFYLSKNENENRHTFLTLSSGPAYNALAFKLGSLSQKQLTHAMLFSAVMSNSYLWDEVRGRNGAYGVNSTVEMQEGIMTFTSYRDPLIEKTYGVFESAFSAPVDSEKLEYATVSILGREIRVLTPQQKCNEAFKRWLYKMTDEIYLERRQSLLEAKPEDISSVMEQINSCYNAKHCKATVCGRDMVPSDCNNKEIIVLPQ